MGMDATELLSLAVGLLRANPYGFLITIGDGQPRARLVQPIHVDGSATLSIGTSPRSRKVKDLRRTEDATFAAEDRGQFAYVTLTGTCSIIEDEAARRERWIDGLAPFFPAGPAGDDFVVLELRARRIEVMDFTRRVHPDPYGLVPAVIQWGDSGWRTVAADRAD